MTIITTARKEKEGGRDGEMEKKYALIREVIREVMLIMIKVET